MSAPPSLDDKYAAGDGRALMSGVQALVRLTLEQRRLDTARGLDTAVYVSGYQGSPLGTVDLEMGRAKRFLAEAGVVFQAGVNEELAATAVAGSQLIGRLPGRRYDGVTGFWYGKNPGLDRAADAIRHGMLAGTAPLGGAVAWIGDDPDCKSSTVPSSCEPMCQSLSMPLLAPGSVQEIVEYGLHAVALSRACGLWVGLKIVANIADASATVDLSGLDRDVPEPERRVVGDGPALVGPSAVAAEHDMFTRRLDLAREYARTHRLNRVTFSATRATLGIVASGTSFATVERALADLGIDEAEAERLGLRLVRLGMPFPLDRGQVAELTEGLDRLLVVEDKTPFLEGHLQQALYRRPDAPAVLGRSDESGRPLLSARGTLGADDVAAALARVVGEDRLGPRAVAHLAVERPAAARRTLPLVAARTPFFCSGCPHNRSTRTTDDTLVGVGIGCHAMIALDDGGGRGHQIGLTQMGGEGAQWLGLAPFTDDRHFVQNLGDGTFHHSGSLAIRAAVAGGVKMTYKLLYNDAVAMTGGQRAEGRVDVPALTRLLMLEGVTRVVVTTPEPETYQGVSLDHRATVRHRDDLPAVERELAELDGVTVIVHDDRCATEERRLRKRGLLPTPKEKVVVNERVCEGCGDCASKSTCMSVQSVDTELGRKTRIHQASCNTDLSCLSGDCPSFLLVEPGTGPRTRRATPDLPVALVEPQRRPASGAEVVLRMPGIGGTGVVTVSQILQMAAHVDGLHAAGLEQIGLAQKGGPVVSDVRIGKDPVAGAVKASRGTVDVLVGFDLLGAAADANLATCRADRTVAVVNTAVVPTIGMVTGRVLVPGTPDDALLRIASVTRPDAVHAIDANGLSEALFGDHMPVNLLLLGAVYQHGLLPVSAQAMEQAITLNGTAVEKNLAAFRWGRASVQDPDAVARAVAAASASPTATGPVSLAGSRTTSLEEAVALRVTDLTGYQSGAYAQVFEAAVREVVGTATARAGEEAGRRIGLAYARSLHRLMAYKDEYEVARLHLDPAEQARLRAEFGPGARVSVLLHPPALRALGMRRKIRLRRTATPTFRVLAAARRLRGTPLDVFGYAQVRRVERALVEEFRATMLQALGRLTPATAEAVEAIAALPEEIRGYEDIKLARVAEYRERTAAALDALAAASRERVS
ncbi:indolepyruvate ferredoxin oxidoreductase family protein [Kineosporia sp. A_224]|uniref:indolepyruvate ferredoxin oxidoreductase family protein n=1 Tax=Kineosporia sp. A_224 TaxID=1962180 RepID=UPI0018E96FFE|nr:indolepyruvate ferredoxin oxidoreductase family protein [Kineosporia sp. A_224]